MAIMKTFLLIVAAFVISVSPARSQDKLTKSQKAVQNTVIKLFDALADRDTASLRSWCTADILLFENGKTWNLDTLIQGVRMNQAADFKRFNTISFIDTKVDKNVAWATYNNQAEITKNGKHISIKWLETVILVKEEKMWKIKVLHSTLISRN